jgi:hypothetical protein
MAGSLRYRIPNARPDKDQPGKSEGVTGYAMPAVWIPNSNGGNASHQLHSNTLSEMRSHFHHSRVGLNRVFQLIQFCAGVTVNGFLKISTILLWAIGLGSEYAIQRWPARKRLLNLVAAFAFGFALLGEYGSYRFDSLQLAQLEAKVNAQGIPVVEWFQAQDVNEEAFTLRQPPLPGSVEVLINGLTEPADVFSVHEKSVTVSTKLSSHDAVTIKYRQSP